MERRLALTCTPRGRVARPTDKPDHPLVYLDDGTKVDAFFETITETSELAVDTEGASFHRFVDRIYLLQISTRDQSAIVDPLAIGSPPGFGALLENPQVEIIFHDADYDLRLLHQDYGWQVRNVFDTRIAAQLIGLKAFGLAALLERYFDVKLDKKHQRADWSRRPLSDDMLAYAAQDTRWLHDLRDILRGELERLGRLDWAREEFGLLESVRWDEDAADTAFMRMKGARDLSRRELALLRELVQWRDGVARELDRATFRVIGNETLFELARLAPTTRDGLASVKGMPRGILDGRGEGLIEAIRRGLAVEENDLPRFPRSPRWDRDPDFDARAARVKAVRDAVAAELDLDPGVLCARDRMEAVARRNPTSREELATVTELRRWQADVLGDRFIAALRSGGGAPTPSPAPAASALAAATPALTGAEESDAAATGFATPNRTASASASQPARRGSASGGGEESPYRD